MRIDEEKALRLRRSQLVAEIAAIDARLPSSEPGFVKNWAPKSAKGTEREQFYKDAENDFRNTDSNGNYVTPEDC